MSPAKRTGIVTRVTDLTPTAREVVITLNEALDCPPGSFVNVFKDVNGTRVRRAFSVVAVDLEHKTITLSIRRSPHGTMTPEFWKADIIGETVEVMGPMGVNTIEKLGHPTVHLFAYGIGAGVIKAIADAVVTNPHVTNITITTGSRTENDIIYKSHFDALRATHPHVSVQYVVSSPESSEYPLKGYAQDYISDLSFDDADVYMCGQQAACDALKEKITGMQPINVSFFVEAFH